MNKKTILEYLQEHHIVTQAMCNGKHTCGKCKVKVLNRNVDVSLEEEKLLSEEEINNNIRLACFHEYCNDDKIMSLNSVMDIEDDLEEYHNQSIYDGIGLIADIGTTTIVMKWIDRSNGHTLESVSFVNPQVTFGGDVISRIDYSNKHGYHILHNILIESIEAYLIDRDLRVDQMIFTGNTTMIHFLLDKDVSSIGQAPFHVPVKDMQRISSQMIFKNYKYECDLITFPHISAFVGGDIVSGIYACDMDKSEENILFVDLGTNGEMAVGNKESLLVTSTAAGPAFEGVGITCGGSSVPGAISKVKLNPLNIETIGNIEPVCICGSGLISLFSELVREEMINPIGKIINGNRIDITNNIYIDQNDITNFQLAKAAIETGIILLLEEYPVDTIYISGGFGSHISIDDLKEIQVVPRSIHNVKSLGNSALSGCYKLLMSQDFERVNNIVKIAKSINLADHEDFEDTLIESLYFYD